MWRIYVKIFFGNIASKRCGNKYCEGELLGLRMGTQIDGWINVELGLGMAVGLKNRIGLRIRLEMNVGKDVG